ncbi:MAG: TetR/AcrR family transcriptional regulator [Candidatus Marinimicrobia bacterium]|jgi:TetR/AcrR family fatty acid metabolism transcriptional regulator|nr:TetR/AcrR family transcriptional regulator [Candidatus Neomarinimicrobiota bacterium]
MNFTERQEEIIKMSINIIAEKGIQNLTIKNISKAIGISEPAIYRHFESKMDILLAILSYFKKSNSIVLETPNLESKNTIQQIGSIYSNHFKQFKKNHALASVIFSEDIFKNDNQLSKKVASIMQSNNIVISKIIKTGQENNEIRNDIPVDELALIIMGALRLIVKKWRMANFSFDLEKEGTNLWNSIEKTISKK